VTARWQPDPVMLLTLTGPDGTLLGSIEIEADEWCKTQNDRDAARHLLTELYPIPESEWVPQAGDQVVVLPDPHFTEWGTSRVLQLGAHSGQVVTLTSGPDKDGDYSTTAGTMSRDSFRRA
jgi:hypothetical protein